MRILIPITLLLIISCNTPKQIQRKDDAAIERATSKLSNLQRVAEIVRDRFPCATDTTVQWVHDSTTVTNTIYKTKTDTFTKDGTKYIFRLDTAFFEKTRYQTQTKIVVDREKENRLTDSLNSNKTQLAFYKGRNAELNDQLAADKRTIRNLWWIIVGLSVFTILSHVLRSKLPIKL